MMVASSCIDYGMLCIALTGSDSYLATMYIDEIV